MLNVNLHRFSPGMSLAGLAMLNFALCAQDVSAPGASAATDRNASDSDGNTSIKYPVTNQVEIVDEYHGRKVEDPYRWLEDTESDQTAAWVAAQNEVTDRYLQSIPARAAMKERLEKLWNYERYDLPRRKGSTYFYTHNDGLQNQSVLYKAGSLDAARQTLLDPNSLSKDGTIASRGRQDCLSCVGEVTGGIGKKSNRENRVVAER